MRRKAWQSRGKPKVTLNYATRAGSPYGFLRRRMLFRRSSLDEGEEEKRIQRAPCRNCLFLNMQHPLCWTLETQHPGPCAPWKQSPLSVQVGSGAGLLPASPRSSAGREHAQSRPACGSHAGLCTRNECHVDESTGIHPRPWPGPASVTSTESLLEDRSGVWVSESFFSLGPSVSPQPELMLGGSAQASG